MIENMKNILLELKNESCRESYVDHDPALFRAGNLAPGNFRAGPAPVPIAPIGFLLKALAKHFFKRMAKGVASALAGRLCERL